MDSRVWIPGFVFLCLGLADLDSWVRILGLGFLGLESWLLILGLGFLDLDSGLDPIASSNL